jgi:hypothetical protein
LQDSPSLTSAKWSADRIGGAIWVIFGAAVVYGSWTMDRLPSLGIPPLTAPGLVPGLLGLGFVVFGAILLLRSETAAAPDPAALHAEGFHKEAPAPPDAIEWRRVALSWALCIIYAGALLGRGLPYWLLTVAFLFLHLLLIDEDRPIGSAPTRRRMITAAILAALVPVAVTLIFQHLFLIRLP